MEFTNKIDAIKYIIGLGADTVICISEQPSETASDTEELSPMPDIDAPVEESSKVTLGSVQLDGYFCEDVTEHTIFVEDYKVTPNSCGTGVIKFEDKTLVLNMCQMDENTTVYLPTVINGVSNHNTPFKVIRSTGKEPNKILLAK